MKAADLLVPGMVTTDVGGINEKSLISCFFEGKDMSEWLWGKRQILCYHSCMKVQLRAVTLGAE